jgi:hypothetical protein
MCLPLRYVLVLGDVLGMEPALVYLPLLGTCSGWRPRGGGKAVLVYFPCEVFVMGVVLEIEPVLGYLPL